MNEVASTLIAISSSPSRPMKATAMRDSAKEKNWLMVSGSASWAILQQHMW
jgi:hypothetical protein